jgi:hypothetical protein
MQFALAARKLPAFALFVGMFAAFPGGAQASPAVRIASPAHGTTIAAHGRVLTVTAPRGARLTCRVDRRKLRRCGRRTPLRGLDNGTHSAWVKAVAPDGAVSVAATRFRVDTKPPKVTITTPYWGQVFTGTATAKFYASEPAKFTCRVDANAPVACSSPASSSTIPDGRHMLTVSARDAAGNVGSAQVEFYVKRPVVQPEPEPEPTAPTPEPTAPTPEPEPTPEPTGPTSEPEPDPTPEPTGPTGEPTPTPTPDPAPSPSAQALALDSSHISVTWQPPVTANTVEIVRRDLVDSTPDVVVATVPAAAGSLTDSQLWYGNSYRYTLNFKDSGGAQVASLTATGTTASTTAATLPVLFSNSPHIGAKLTSSTPMASSSTSTRYRDYIVAHVRNANLTLRSYGIPVYEAKVTDPLIGPFSCGYNCQLPRSGSPSVPLPTKPKPAGSGYPKLSDPGSDHHMSVISQDGNTIWDFYRPDEDNTDVNTTDPAVWKFVQAGATFQPKATTPAIAAPPSYAGANAANFANLAGLVRPEELALGEIRHALMMGVPGIGTAGAAGTNLPACPATHNALVRDPLTGSYNPDSPPEGLRMRLNPSFNVASLSRPWERTIARAMQEYGVYVRDNSGTLAIYGETTGLFTSTGETRGGRGYDGWNKAKLGLTTTGGSAGFSSEFPWSQLEVVAFTAGPNCG